MIGDILIQCFSAFVATIGFGIIIDVPKRALIYCGITGMVGWMVNWVLIKLGVSDTLAIFMGSMSVSLLSLQFARMTRIPTTLYNIPAIFVLVPGIKAYQTMKTFIGGDYIGGVELMIKTFTLSVTIAIAIVMTEVVYRLIARTLKSMSHKTSM